MLFFIKVLEYNYKMSKSAKTYSSNLLEKTVNDWVAMGYSESRIQGSIEEAKGFQNLDSSLLPKLKAEIKFIIDNHNNYAIIQRAVNSHIMQAINSKDEIIVYDDINHCTVEVKGGLHAVMSPAALRPRIKLVKLEYNPRSKQKLYNPTGLPGDLIYNVYQPPFWLKNHWNLGQPLEAQPMPEVYNKFFLSLLDNDVDSYNYLLNWIATSLKTKNMKMLGAVGSARIGKGLLAEIIAELHGKAEGNGVASGSGTKLSSQFNSVLANRTFFEFSEIKLVTAEEKMNWKNLINTQIEVEKKGVDARMEINYANVYVTSNNASDLRALGTGDQRLSLINLTTKKLEDRLTELGYTEISALLADLRAPDNIAKLGAYFWHYPINRDLADRLFQSNTLKNFRKSQLLDWQKEFLSNYCRARAGQTVKVVDVCTWLDETLNKRLKLGPTSFERLRKTVEPILAEAPSASFFTLTKTAPNSQGERFRALKIAELNQQPPESLLEDLEVVEDS